MQMLQEIWQRPSHFELAPQQVHVWSAALDLPMAIVPDLAEQLQPDEQERAQGLLRPQDQRDFVLRRLLLKKLLARYLGRPLQDVVLSVTAHGKLQVAEGAQGIHFNVSVSEGKVMFAVGRDIEVGIDLERIRGDFDIAGLSQSHFDATEQLHLQSDGPSGFFKLWTKKEARLKLSGAGLASAALPGPEVALVELPAWEGYCACLATYVGCSGLEMIRWAVPGALWPIQGL